MPSLPQLRTQPSRSVARAQPKNPSRHRQILDAALEEFSAKGYASARLDDVAKRAGIAKGTIYLYFKNKELLFRAVLRDLITQVFEDFEQYVRKSSSSTEELIRELISRQYAQLVASEKARSMFRLLISEGHHFPQLSEMYYREIILPGISTIRLILEKGAPPAESHPFSVVEFPQILISPGVLAIVWSLILNDRHPLPLEIYQEAHLQFVLAALRGAWRSAAQPAAESTARQEAP